MFFCIILAQENPQKLKFKHLTVDQGLSHAWILDILKDKHNFMWFAAANGLNKYDGYNFEVFQHSIYDSFSIPQSLVSDLFEDSQGIIWIATGDGLSRYNREQNNFQNYYPDSTSKSILGRVIQTINEDNQGRIWVSTADGVNLYHRDTDSFTQFSYESQNLQRIAPTNLSGDMIADKNDNLWIGTVEYGLIKFNISDETFKQYFLGNYDEKMRSTSSVTSIEMAGDELWIGTLGNGLIKFDTRYKNGGNIVQYKHDPRNPASLSNDNVLSLLYISENKIWIGTENYGLDLFNPKTEKFLHHLPDSNYPYCLNNGSIYSLYADSSDNLWVGTYAGGINVSFVNHGNIELYRGGFGTENSISNNVITQFLEDKKGNLWIGTDGGGLNYLDRERNTYKNYTTKNSNLKSDAIQTIAFDSKGNLWVSAWEGGINRFNELTGRFYSITTADGLPDNNVISFLIDSKERIWIGCFFSGLVLLDNNYRIQKIYNHKNSGLKEESVRLLREDSKRNIFIGTDNGMFIFNPEDDSFKKYLKNPEDINSISSNQVYAIAEQKNGIIWFGTSYGLNRFDLAKEEFVRFYKEDGLPSNMVVGLVFDYNGHLWISTDKGLARMDVERRKFKTYSISDGLQGNQFNINSNYRTSRNEILFGGTNGFNVFHPDSLKENMEMPPVVFTDFQIFNKPVMIGKDEPLKKHISVAQSIEMSHKESVFSLSFSALSYEAPEQNQYAYKMEGFDRDWIFAGNHRDVTYTNLSPGKYTFRVKASNNDGIWNETGTSISIYIHPPFWQTVWFRIIIIFLIFAIVATFHITRINIEKTRNRQLENRVKNRTRKLKELNDELESFTYSVSHDLRTPLRTITGFSDIIEQDYIEGLSEDVKKYFNKIKSAGLLMGLLIEDLLKLTRIGQVEMEMSHLSMSTLVQEIYDNLRLTEPEQNVNFKIQSGVTAVADKQLVRILLDNLIQNAWKYTKNESDAQIEFGKINDKDKSAFYVRDNGVGFDMNFADKLFQPFIRLHKENEFEGTGVGLATVKRIIDRHGGEIWAESVVDQGTTIFFNFGIL